MCVCIDMYVYITLATGLTKNFLIEIEKKIHMDMPDFFHNTLKIELCQNSWKNSEQFLTNISKNISFIEP